MTPELEESLFGDNPDWILVCSLVIERERLYRRLNLGLVRMGHAIFQKNEDGSENQDVEIIMLETPTNVNPAWEEKWLGYNAEMLEVCDKIKEQESKHSPDFMQAAERRAASIKVTREVTSNGR